MAMDVYVVKNIVDRAIELGYIIPGYSIEDYIYNAVEEYGFLSILIIGPVGSGKSNLALQLAYAGYKDWDVVLERLVFKREEFLELLSKYKRIPLVIWDDIGAYLPSTLYFTDRKAWEQMRKIWETIRTKLNVFIATAPKRGDVVSFIGDKSDMLIIMHHRKGFVGSCEVQRRVVLQDYSRDKEFTRLILVENLEFPLKPSIKAKDSHRFPGIPQDVWEKYWNKRVMLSEEAVKEALEYEREAGMLTVNEVARMFRVSPQTVIRLIEKGEIVAYKIGNQWRIPRKEVDKLKTPYMKAVEPVEAPGYTP